MAKVYYAYIYTNPINFEQLYVGKGTRDRAMTHMAPRGSENSMLRNMIEKLKAKNVKPIVTKLITSTEDFAFMLEQGLIRHFGKRCNGTGTLCNFSDGGDGPINLVRSEEAKLKTSQTLKKYYETHTHFQTPASIAKMKVTKKANPTGTGKWMNNGTILVKVKHENVEAKLAEGWKLGILRKHITEEYKNKQRANAYMQWQRQKGIN